MLLRLLVALSPSIVIEGVRFSTITRKSLHFRSKTSTADPYGWDIQMNDVSKNSCYSLEEPRGSPIHSLRDTECVGYAKPSSKCRGGFPFYRFSAGSEDCIDCMEAGQCQLMCLSKGMDAAALVFSGDRRGAVECRCGATKNNMAVWGMLKAASADRQVNFGPVHSLLPPSTGSAVAMDDPRCRMVVFVYTDERESDGGIPSQFVETNGQDDFYIRSIVSGLADPGDVEDSSVEEMARVNRAMKERLELWLNKNPTGKVPADEMFVEQTSRVKHHTSPQCNNVNEPETCFESAVGAVLAANGWEETNPDGSYTSQYMTMMMSVSYVNWQSLFGVNVGNASQTIIQYKPSSYCSEGSNANNCPITCGKCGLYERSSQVASEFPTWLNENKDASTGIVTIPYVFDSANQFITPDIVSLTNNATAIWAAVTCVNFQQVAAAVPTASNAPYVLITAQTDSNGNPTGCLADPVGYPSPGSRPATINVGGCPQNKKPLGSLVHEFGHVLGMAHTQMRPDRDNYIQMNPAMVIPGYEPNFFLAPYDFDGDDGQYSPYDYGSIMQYTRTQAANPKFYNASDPHWSGTFELLQPLPAGVQLGQRNQLSASDIAEINSLYQCGNVLANTAHVTGPISSSQSQPVAPTQAPASSQENASLSPAQSQPVAVAPSQAPGSSQENSSLSPAQSQSVPPSQGAPSKPTLGSGGANGTTAAGSTVNVWDGWEENVKTIADGISGILESANITLSSDQVDLLQNLLDQEQKIYSDFDKAVTTQQFTSGWRNTVTGVAASVLKIIGVARASSEAFKAGRNPSKQGVLDSQSVQNLVKIIKNTQLVYEKFDAYSNSFFPSHDAKEMLKSRKARLVVFRR